MVELFCFMCAHVWNDKLQDKCPKCGHKDFLATKNDDFNDDGHYEGDFKVSPANGDDYED